MRHLHPRIFIRGYGWGLSPKLALEDKLRIGCSGWSYEDWLGHFYPKELQQKDYLGFYSKVFNCVEIDSSFYRVPNAFMINAWKNSTPKGFIFSPKLPKKITHDNKLQSSESQLLYFYSMVSKLGDKLGPIAIQLPPSVKLSTHLEVLENLPHATRARVQARYRIQTQILVHAADLQAPRKSSVAMVWSLNQYVETPPEETSDFFYLRLVGDREISSFTGIQRDRTDEMKRWAQILQREGERLRKWLRLLQ